jgi:hypothetical protein
MYENHKGMYDECIKNWYECMKECMKNKKSVWVMYEECMSYVWFMYG